MLKGVVSSNQFVSFLQKFSLTVNLSDPIFHIQFLLIKYCSIIHELEAETLMLIRITVFIPIRFKLHFCFTDVLE